METIIIGLILIGAVSAFVFRNILSLNLLRIISCFSVLCLCLSIAGFLMLQYKMPLPFSVWYFGPLTMLLLIFFLITFPFLVVCWLKRKPKDGGKMDLWNGNDKR